MTVIQLVDRERARLRAAMTLIGVGLALAIAAAVLAVATLVFGEARWIALPRPLPVVAWAVVAALLAGAAWRTLQVLRLRASRAAVATEIEQERALRRGSLRGAIEVADANTLGRRGAQQLGSRLEHEGPVLAPTLQRRTQWRALAGVAGAVLAVATLGAARAATPDGWRALAHPVRAWRGTLAPPIRIVAPRLVLRGERVPIRVEAVDRRAITLHQRATGTQWRATRHDVADTTAQIVVGPVDADLILVAGDGRTSSDTVVMRVTDRPFVGDVSMRAHFPAYLERPEEVVPVGEPARLPRGTVLSITGHASTAFASVELAHGADTVRLSVDGHAFSGRMIASETGRWAWVARGGTTDIADVPSPLELDVIPDSAPRVEIMSPAADTLVTGREALDVTIAALDDHGLRAVSLRTWRQQSTGRPGVPVEARLVEAKSATQWSGAARLDLASRGLEPGDALHVVAVASDASPWGQTTLSRELVIRVPTASEQREIARDAADSAVAEAMAAVSAQKDLEQRTSEASRARNQRNADAGDPSSASGSDGKPLSFEQAEKARALSAEQKQLGDRIEELKKAAATMEEQLKQAGALDSGLASRLAEARALLEQAMTPELAAQMRKLEEALQKLSSDDAQGALRDLAEQQRQLREQLERSAEMLKRAALEGSMQTLRDEAKELADKERALADSLLKGLQRQANDSAGQGRKAQASDLEERSRELAKDVAKLSERLAQENAETGAKKTSAAGKDVEQSAAAMERAAKSMPQDTKSPEQRAQSAPKPGEQQPGAKPGEQKAADMKATGQPQAGQQQDQQGQKQAGQQGQPQAGQQGQNQQGQQGQNQQGQQGAQAANDAAKSMERAADQLAQARQSQIDEWKSELTGELDQSIQEMLQLARQQEQLEQKLKDGADPAQMRGEQGALQQGVQKASERLQQAGQKSSLLSPQSQRAAGEAQSKVEQATREVAEPRSSGQTASAMRDASEALNRAAASLVRDRERANSAKSASGFAEMLEQLQEMAQRQGGLNSQSASLLQSGMGSAQAQEMARELAKQQRGVARDLGQLGDATGKSEDLAREAQRIAEALDAGRVDPTTIQRQQQLFRRMLDAGRTLEQDERDDSGKREAQAAKAHEGVTPQSDARGRDAVKFREPTWNELRGLTPEERRAVIEYYKRINGGNPP
jgi:hypothetical protein